MAREKTAVVVNIGDMEMTPEQVTEKARLLRSVTYSSFDPMMTVKIVKTIEGQAANGDHKSQQIYLGLIASAVPEAPQPAAPGNLVQVNVGAEQKDRVSIQAIDAADVAVIAQVITDRGPLAADVLESECNLPAGTIAAMLGNGFIEENGNGMVKLAARKKLR